MKHYLLLGTALTLAIAGQSAFAQTSDEAIFDEIVVTATRARQQAELKQKLEQDVVFDSLSQDEIAAVPDFNVADSLRRIARVVTEFDEDEGRFVNIRGIDANLNYITFDGIGVPSTGAFGGSGRNVNIEFFPSTGVKSLNIYKTFTPDIDGSSIGGYVDVITRSAFDKDGVFSVTKLTGTHYTAEDIAQNSDEAKFPFRLESTLATQFGNNDQFGIVLTGIYGQRPREQDRLFAVGGIENTFANVTPPTRFDSSLTSNNQKRYGGQGKLEYQADDTYASVSAYHYKQDENETRFRNNLRFGAGDIAETGPNQAVIANARMELNYDFFPIKTQGKGVQAHFETGLGKGKLDADIGWAEQNFDHDTPALVFRTGFVPELGVGVDASGVIPSRTVFNDPTYFSNPDNYALSFIRNRDLNTDETVTNALINYGWNTDKNDRGWGFKTGAAIRKLERVRDNEEFRFNSADFATVSANTSLSGLFADESFSSDYSPDIFLFFDGSAVRSFISGLNIPRDVGRSTSADFSYEEDILSLYGMGTFRADRITAIAGVRFESTDFSSSARGDDANNTSGSNEKFLPSVNLSYEPYENLFIRMAYSKTLGRPNPGDLVSTFSETLPGDSESGLLEIRRGNPDLEPRVSDNLDLSVEYFFNGGEGLLSAAVFSKDIEGDIFLTTQQTTIDGQQAIVTQNTNASSSKVEGLELQAYMGTLPFLPEALKGFGFSANATFLNGNTKFLDGTSLDRRVRQADFTTNLAAFYNTGKFETRLAYNYSDDFLLRANRVEDSFEQYDASARYYVNNNIVLSVEGRNLTNQRRRQLTGSNLDLLFGETIIGRQFHFGLTYKY